uniref:Chromosome 17 open reading frame 64 n=1 Tax=Strix occidentalis caurina TaxID=311401 RepID=A0A8D0FKA9_STROC
MVDAAKEVAFLTGSESAPPCKTLLNCCADGLDQDTFKICKELFRPFKKSLRKLQLLQHLPREKKLKYMQESLTVIGDRIDTFLQQYCRASEVKHWQKMFWRFISLFSTMDGKQLQKLHKYIKNNRMHKLVVSKQRSCSLKLVGIELHFQHGPCRRLGQAQDTTSVKDKSRCSLLKSKEPPQTPSHPLAPEIKNHNQNTQFPIFLSK